MADSVFAPLTRGSKRGEVARKAPAVGERAQQWRAFRSQNYRGVSSALQSLLPSLVSRQIGR